MHANLIACGAVLLLLAAVNGGPALWSWLRRPKTSSPPADAPAVWAGDAPAPAAFVDYLAAVEAASAGLDAPSVLTVLRGGLCPDAAAVVKAVKQG